MASAETSTMADANMAFMMEAPPSGPRISFSADLSSSDSDGDYICINPKNLLPGKVEQDKSSSKAGDFEFLSNTQTMLTADELFSEGKFLPFRHVKHSEKLQNVTLKTKAEEQEQEQEKEQDKEDRKVMKDETVNNSNRGSWFLDDDPSPRPPKCTVLWKELLRLKKQRNSTKASSLSPSSSSSSTSSSSSSIGDAVKKEEREKKGKKGLERTRSLTMRIRPMIHVPVCTPPSKPPLFPLRLQRNKVERRT
ncbi:unnamed protein product [Brassica rapa]|uniref:Uncharacterized protein n=1 Tax=Brassica campestris TaxID=3711 RepID=A0A3P5ZU33_BRACM|nr:unnamed protein product [Brassica rapa]VDC79044.1 unnamed protein product [Brassica rapa]